MNKDDIIRMALEAAERHGHTFKEQPNDAVLETMAEAYAMGAAAEREACAKVCEARYMGDNNREDMEAKRCAEAIRARGETK